MKYDINEEGYYGEFGGTFIPEMLYNNVTELKKAFTHIVKDKTFQQELFTLLKDYVGRPNTALLRRKTIKIIQHQYLAQTRRP